VISPVMRNSVMLKKLKSSLYSFNMSLMKTGKHSSSNSPDSVLTSHVLNLSPELDPLTLPWTHNLQTKFADGANKHRKKVEKRQRNHLGKDSRISAVYRWMYLADE
jgi:hypothetical protein